jgi:hypothetical protein
MDTPSSDNYTLGKGVVSFNRYLNGAYQGYRDVGNVPELTLNIDISKLDHFSSRSGIRSKDKSVVQETTPTVSFSLDEITDENFMFSLLGTGTSSSQNSSDYSTSTPTISALDTYVDLDDRMVKGITYLKFDAETGEFTAGETLTGGTSGATATIDGVATSTESPEGTVGILVLSSVSGTFENNETITDGATGSATSDGTVTDMDDDNVLVAEITADTVTVYTSGTDYMVSTFDGRINFKSSGSVTTSSNITCIYAVEEAEFTEISMLEENEISGRFRFVSDNAAGTNYELVLWDVGLVPEGDTALIGDDWASLAFSGEILKDESGHPSQPYGKMIVKTG